MLRLREDIIGILQHNLKKAQHRMKTMVDKHRIDRQHNIGDMVYVKLQPYRQVTMHQDNQKLQPKYLGPFLVIGLVGKVAYKL